jgi:hypothetical protein
MQERIILIIIAFIFTGSLRSQEQGSFFERIELRTDTAVYYSEYNTVEVNNEKRTYFYYSIDNQAVEVRLFVRDVNYRYELMPSRDFDLVDSLINIGSYYRFKVQFKNLTSSDLLRLTIGIETDSIITFEEIPLQPFTYSTANVQVKDNELFIGEEKVFEVFSNNIENLNVSGEWISTDNFDYRYSKDNSRIYLHVVPQKLGNQKLVATIRAFKPFLNKQNDITYNLDPIQANFLVKASRLQFLSLDRNEVTLSDDNRNTGIEVQLDNSRLLTMNRTYRIEAQEEKGGALIAELYTKRQLGK